MTIARDSMSNPTLGVIQHYRLEGPDVLCHASWLSWELFQMVKRAEFPQANFYSEIKGSKHYKALKHLHMQSLHGLCKDPRNVMPIHPSVFLAEIADNHVNAAKHHGYWGCTS